MNSRSGAVQRADVLTAVARQDLCLVKLVESGARTVTLDFEAVPVTAVGAPGDYLARPDFWRGMGVAASGPGPLAFDAEHTHCVDDLRVFVRQHHGERDFDVLGELVRAETEEW